MGRRVEDVQILSIRMKLPRMWQLCRPRTLNVPEDVMTIIFDGLVRPPLLPCAYFQLIAPV